MKDKPDLFEMFEVGAKPQTSSEGEPCSTIMEYILSGIKIYPSFQYVLREGYEKGKEQPSYDEQCQLFELSMWYGVTVPTGYVIPCKDIMRARHPSVKEWHTPWFDCRFD